jgi:uncharacterized RDD family membrane protein YckC
MTYPPNQDPYANQQPQYGAPQQPQYGAPQQPQYGQPQQAQYGQPQYGAPAGYGAPAVNYAGWPQRVGGYLIDVLVLLPFYVLAWVVGIGDDGINLFYSIFLLLGIAVSGYNRWYQQGKTGQTWGKKVVGIRLVSEQTGQPIGPGMAFARDFVHIVDSAPCFIGYLWPLWDEKRQTLADKILKTVVVN